MQFLVKIAKSRIPSSTALAGAWSQRRTSTFIRDIRNSGGPEHLGLTGGRILIFDLSLTGILTNIEEDRPSRGGVPKVPRMRILELTPEER